MRFSATLKIVIFAGFYWVVGCFSKLVLVYEETTCCLRNFVGYFSDFFPWNFENVRRNIELLDEIVGKCPKFEMNEPKKTIRRREKCVLIS